MSQIFLPTTVWILFLSGEDSSVEPGVWALVGLWTGLACHESMRLPLLTAGSAHARVTNHRLTAFKSSVSVVSRQSNVIQQSENNQDQDHDLTM